MLLENYEISQVLDCIADSSKIRVVASLSNQIDEVFPYLNAILNNVTYNHEAKIIILKKEHRLITVYSDMVTMAKVDDEQDVVNTLNWIRELVNDTWEKRDEITPSFQKQQLLGPVDIYGLLPKTNCKLCGESTCFAFACGLLTGTRSIEQCTVLDEPEYVNAKDYLWSALIADDVTQL